MYLVLEYCNNLQGVAKIMATHIKKISIIRVVKCLCKDYMEIELNRHPLYCTK